MRRWMYKTDLECGPLLRCALDNELEPLVELRLDRLAKLERLPRIPRGKDSSVSIHPVVINLS